PAVGAATDPATRAYTVWYSSGSTSGARIYGGVGIRPTRSIAARSASPPRSKTSRRSPSASTAATTPPSAASEDLTPHPPGPLPLEGRGFLLPTRPRSPVARDHHLRRTEAPPSLQGKGAGGLGLPQTKPAAPPAGPAASAPATRRPPPRAPTATPRGHRS